MVFFHNIPYFNDTGIDTECIIEPSAAQYLKAAAVLAQKLKVLMRQDEDAVHFERAVIRLRVQSPTIAEKHRHASSVGMALSVPARSHPSAISLTAS